MDQPPLSGRRIARDENGDPILAYEDNPTFYDDAERDLPCSKAALLAAKLNVIRKYSERVTPVIVALRCRNKKHVAQICALLSPDGKASLRAVARSVGLTPAAVSKLVLRIEADLEACGLPLFRRARRTIEVRRKCRDHMNRYWRKRKGPTALSDSEPQRTPEKRAVSTTSKECE